MSFISSSIPLGAASALVPGSVPVASTAGTTTPLFASLSTRDAAVADLPALSSSVNLLAQAASTAASSASAGTSDPAEQLTLPPLPQMPAPQTPPAVPTDDHGSSNVVFSDPDADGSLIH
jgi:hypothetical protein